MTEPNKDTSKFPNYITVEGDGTQYPEIHCPVCGKKTIHTRERCPHVLFYIEDSTLDGIAFGYIHPKLKAQVQTLKEKYVNSLQESERETVERSVLDRSGNDNVERLSADLLATELGLNADSTWVLNIENMLTSPACSDIFDVAVGIEFPPGSKELKAYKRWAPESATVKPEEKSTLPDAPERKSTE